jgi:peroxiredoxin
VLWAALLLLFALPPEAERERAPSFELADSTGSLVRISDYRGKVVLINFWATWCLPCKEEIPWFTEFERKYREQGFSVLGISLDKAGWAVINPYAQKMGLDYRVVLGDARTAYKYGEVESLPATFLVDRQGRVASTHLGLVNRKKVEAEIRELLASAR